ncbi:YifB family Mg chelatase-like AAA ATPase [Longirhabdus pacifica]|uniref:YifB family Mg chelatase-like AAA ATPase n=1 Tax=Longirhabdus pacifica TaxID=2305227 RepID=UPI00100926AF|nr:YifB family Mg chelatase-like AAA ATPase [Longirhabdus pacifica]
MYTKLLSCCIQGIDGQIIEVEVDISPGLPQFNIVGLPDSAVRESIERVRAAIKNSQFQFPTQRITVNLAPADLKKEGSSFDLAIAAGILLASKQVQMDNHHQTIFIGELSLEGSLRPINGMLSMIHHIKRKGIRHIVLPYGNLEEASLISNLQIGPLTHLKQLSSPIVPYDYHVNIAASDRHHEMKHDYVEVKGQHHVKRALMIAAAGMHNILLIGPPGTGKTMMMRRLPSILPPLSEEESLEVTKIYSVCNQLKHTNQLMTERPFRAPHHTITAAGLIGGGSTPKPGEVSLAHYGVLYLDELPEFSRPVLEVMRQPLEDHSITISRARASYTFPTKFILACSMNPCPCGFFGAEGQHKTCTCHTHSIQKYRSKISGPLLDRIDMHVEVPWMNYEMIQRDTKPLSSVDMRRMVQQARYMQQHRYRSLRECNWNSQLYGKQLEHFCALDKETQAFMQQAFESFHLSMRSHDRILKLGRTIADLDGKEHVSLTHLAEAMQYRCLDKEEGIL